MRLRWFVFSVFLAQNFIQSYAENILFYWVVSGYSHRVSIWPVLEALADKGHKVTFLSIHQPKTPSPHPNITDFVPKGLKEDIGISNIDFISIRLEEGVAGIDRLWEEYYQSGIRGCQSIMRNQEFLRWINKASFDLVVIDALYNECAYGLVHKFKAAHIMYTPTSHFPWFKDAYGLPDENLPEMEHHYSINMTFMQSVRNLLSSLYWEWKRHAEIFPLYQPLLETALELSDLPPLQEIEMNTSLVMTNTHFSEEFPRSLPPSFVEIGGTHCTDRRKPLPKEIEEFIQNGNGFVLLSFGTYASLSSLPKHIQDCFLYAMKSIANVKFIVKFDAEPPADLPKHIKTVKWIPQQDIIAHPKCRGFIGHGGLLGTHEAVYHGVPMIVVPLFAEQDYQAVRAQHRKSSLVLEIADLTEEQVTFAILELLNNSIYREKAQRLSIFFRDRPTSPLNTAIWWIEYVMRHKGQTAMLRPVGINKTWYERRMLHIWGFILATVLASITISILLCTFFIKFVKQMLTLRKKKIE